jgi:hypothetical protein
MAIYIYHPEKHAFLGFDERSWEPNILNAAAFLSRELANEIAVRQLGENNCALVLDDGAD